MLLAFWCVSARGAILFNSELASGTGALAGYDILRIYAQVMPTGTETGATGLQAADVTVDSPLNLKFRFADLDLSDGVPDVDVLGQTTAQPTTNTSSAGTFTRVGGVNSFNLVMLTPPGNVSDPNGDGITDTDPSANYAAVKQFRVAGFNTTPDATAFGGNGGKGALVSVIVLPHLNGPQKGTLFVRVDVAADKGIAYESNAFVEVSIPEPGGAAGVWVVITYRLGRRGRRA